MSDSDAENEGEMMDARSEDRSSCADEDRDVDLVSESGKSHFQWKTSVSTKLFKLKDWILPHFESLLSSLL